ncbi:hypothetical protein MBLNU230_g4045t1 [Neophaeotheca triangularis]
MSLTKRTVFTVITPLPPSVTRAQAIRALHDHGTLITLNPLVQNYTATTPHASAPEDERETACAWYEITDTINYLPYNLASGTVTYKACFYDVPSGCQTHVYAPSGLDIRGKWTVGGNEPGEPREERELGLEAPREGLYYREDVDMRCNFLLTGFIKGNLRKSHGALKEKLVARVMEEGVGSGSGHSRQGSRGTEASRNKPLPELPQEDGQQQRVGVASAAPRISSHWEREPSNFRTSFQGHHNFAEPEEHSVNQPMGQSSRPDVPLGDENTNYTEPERLSGQTPIFATHQSDQAGHARYSSQNLDPATAQHAAPRPRAELP